MLSLIYVPAVGASFWAAWTDANASKIPNLVSLLMLFAGLIVVSFAPNPTPHLIAFAIVFVATFSLWAMQAGMGGGDCKLLSGIALVLGAGFIPFMGALALFAFILMRTRHLLPRAWKRRASDMIPLAVPAAPALVAALWVTGVLQ